MKNVYKKMQAMQAAKKAIYDEVGHQIDGLLMKGIVCTSIDVKLQAHQGTRDTKDGGITRRTDMVIPSVFITFRDEETGRVIGLGEGEG